MNINKKFAKIFNFDGRKGLERRKTLDHSTQCVSMPLFKSTHNDKEIGAVLVLMTYLHIYMFVLDVMLWFLYQSYI